MPKQAAALSYAVRFPVLGKYFGQLCLVVAALTVVPLAVSLIHGEMPIAFRYAIVIAVLAGTGAILGRMPAPREVQVNEAMVLVAFMFLLTPLVMSFPMMGSGLSFPDALFEAVSGATTGLLLRRACASNAVVEPRIAVRRMEETVIAKNNEP